MPSSTVHRIPHSIVWALGITQVIGYGSLYYAFGVLAPAIALTFSWPVEWLYGALTAALLVGAAISPLAGSFADSFGAARLMTIGSLGAATSLVICGLAGNGVVFLLGLAAMEIASAFVLYSTAFAALAQLSEKGSRQAITNITLIAGFASSIFWPLTSFLLPLVSWQGVYLVYATLNLLVCLPMHLWIASHTKRSQEKAIETAAAPATAMVPLENQSPVLIVMLIAFALMGFVSSSILVHMVPVLSAVGLGVAASVVAVIFGPAQVAARLINMHFGRDLSPTALALIAATLMPFGTIMLAAFAPGLVGAVAFAVFFGLGSGLGSIVSGTLPLALFGAAGYGRRLGVLGSVRMVSSAFAPFIFSLAMGVMAPRFALAATAIVGIGAIFAFCWIWLKTRPKALPMHGTAQTEEAA